MTWQIDVPEEVEEEIAEREIPMTEEPCPSCLRVFFQGPLRREAIQPLPEGAFAPLDMEGNKWCFDCASANGLTRVSSTLTWEMARTAVGNDRQEQYRLPGVQMGLVMMGLVRPSKEGDFEQHMEWLDRVLPVPWDEED